MRALFTVGLTLIAVVALAACGSPAAPTPPAATPTPASTASATPTFAGTPSATPTAAAGAVEIFNFGFRPSELSVPVGTTVTWTNTSTTTHTVTFDDGSVDSGNVAGGATFSHAFDTAGTFTYHCAIHSSMTGTITVGP